MIGNQNAIEATYKAPKDVVGKVLEKRFDQLRLGKQRSAKGFWLYKEASWTELSSDKIDLYANVEGGR